MEAEGLLSQCDFLGDTTLVVPGESASVLAWEQLRHLVQWPLFLFPYEISAGNLGCLLSCSM